MNKSSKRNSSVEVLKLFALFIIVISHSLPRYGNNSFTIDFNYAKFNLDYILMVLEYYFGQIGNAIFIACSSWFLLDNDKVKSEKVKMIVTDTFSVSFTYILIFILSGVNLDKKLLIKQLFPITFENNWFISCYIIMYLSHGILNKLIGAMDRKQYLNLVLGSVLIYGVLEIIVSSTYRYCDLIGFFMIYLLSGYIKIYMNKQFNWNKIVLFSSTILLIEILMINYFGTAFTIFSDKVLKLCRFNNIIIIMLAVSLLFIALRHKYYSKWLNYISSMSLLIYVIHENHLMSTYVKPIVWEFIFEHFNNSYISLYTIIFAIILFSISTIFAIIYKNSLGIFMNFISNKLYTLLHVCYKWLFQITYNSTVK